MRLDDVFLPYRLTNATTSVVFDRNDRRYIAAGRDGRTLAMGRFTLGEGETFEKPQGINNLDPYWLTVENSEISWKELARKGFPVQMQSHPFALVEDMEYWPKYPVTREKLLSTVDSASKKHGFMRLESFLDGDDEGMLRVFLIEEIRPLASFLVSNAFQHHCQDLTLYCGEQAFSFVCPLPAFDLLFFGSYNSRAILPTTDVGGWAYV